MATIPVMSFCIGVFIMPPSDPVYTLRRQLPPPIVTDTRTCPYSLQFQLGAGVRQDPTTNSRPSDASLPGGPARSSRSSCRPESGHYTAKGIVVSFHNPQQQPNTRAATHQATAALLATRPGAALAWLRLRRLSGMLARIHAGIGQMSRRRDICRGGAHAASQLRGDRRNKYPIVICREGTP